MSVWLWLVLVLVPGLLGLHWFAALGLALLILVWHSGVHSLLILLEFSRIRELEPLLAIPLIWWSAGLLQGKAATAQSPQSTDGRQTAAADWSGLWLLGSTDAAAKHRVFGLSLLPGVAMLSVWASLSVVSPTRAPDLNTLFLAALLPLLLYLLLSTLVQHSGFSLSLSRWSKRRLALLAAATLLLGGLYLNRWTLLDAAAMWAVLVVVLQTQGRLVSPRQAAEMLIDSLKRFGQFALLFGLGLAWAMLLFDSGLNRHWLEPLALALGGGLITGLIAGLGLSALWTAAAWKLGPLPALVILAPWLLSPALHLGIPASVLAVLVVLSLQAGHRLSIPPGKDERQTAPVLELGITALLISLLLMLPALTTWPALLAK